VRRINRWTNLPRVVVVPSLEVLQMCVGSLIQAPFPRRGWTGWPVEAPSSLGCPVILWFVVVWFWTHGTRLQGQHCAVLPGEGTEKRCHWLCRGSDSSPCLSLPAVTALGLGCLGFLFQQWKLQTILSHRQHGRTAQNLRAPGESSPVTAVKTNALFVTWSCTGETWARPVPCPGARLPARTAARLQARSDS